jgi:ribosomal RNA assembly protein
LLQDDWFFEMVDLRDHVGKRSNQQRRIRARIIGSEGKIRKMIEQHTNTEISIYNSTVVLVGDGAGLSSARQAIEMLASGSEHGTVIKHLERERRRSRLDARSIDYIEAKEDVSEPAEGFAGLVPGLSDVANRRGRRLKAAQVDPKDEEAVEQMMELSEDEEVSWEEE